MPVNSRELIEAVQVVADDHNIKVTIKSSIKASAIVGGSTFCGAVLLGPPGIIIGATAGSLYAYCKSKDNFKSAAVIIRDEMTEVQREQLCHHIIEAFREFGPEDIVSLAAMIPLLMTPGHAFQRIAVTQIIKFFTDEMRMHVID